MTGLTTALPHTVTVDGNAYKINTDYRLMLRFETEILNSETRDFKSILALIIPEFYVDRIEITQENANEAVSKLLWFYSCGRRRDDLAAASTGNKKARRYYDFDEDSGYIYAAFLQQYGINLSKNPLHWWEFRALFAGLTDETEMVRIMQYRGTDLSKIKYKPERERLKKLQDIFALKDKRRQRYMSIEERDAARLDYMKKRFEEIRNKVR